MEKFEIFFTQTSSKEFTRLDKIIQKKVNKAIAIFEQTPFLSNVEKLTNHPEAKYRKRIGNWRILFDADFDKKHIYITHIWPRSKDYKK